MACIDFVALEMNGVLDPENKRKVNYFMVRDDDKEGEQQERGQDLLILNVLQRKAIFPGYLFSKHLFCLP